MSEKRMSRKELHQPDRIQEWLYATSNFIYEKRLWFIAGGFVALALLVAGLVGVQFYNAGQIKQANEFYEAQKIMQPSLPLDERQQQQAIEGFQKFLENYPDGLYGAVALMRLGALFTAQKKWSLAEEHYAKAIEHPKALENMKNASKLSLAVVYENQQQWEEANQVIESIEGDAWRDVRWKNLARIALLRGDKASAQKNLEKLIQETPQSVFKQEAETILLTLNQ